MIPYAERLLRAFKTEATASIVSQTNRNRRCADEVSVGVGRVGRGMVDLDRSEGSRMQPLMGAKFINDSLDQPTALRGLWVDERTCLVAQADANAIPSNSPSCGR